MLHYIIAVQFVHCGSVLFGKCVVFHDIDFCVMLICWTVPMMRSLEMYVRCICSAHELKCSRVTCGSVVHAAVFPLFLMMHGTKHLTRLASNTMSAIF